MSLTSRFRFVVLVVATFSLSLILGGTEGLPVAAAGGPPVFEDGDKPKKPKKTDAEAKKKPAKKTVVRWGQRRNESDEEYDKRFAKLLKRVRQAKRGDYSGGVFINEKREEVRMWEHQGPVFYCRSDISQEFAANLAMYMEMIHREYGEVFRRVLQEPARVREPIEVIVFGDPQTYYNSGGRPGSGGYFTWQPNRHGDRSRFWPCKHFRLVQFTDGEKDFAHWNKETLRHEAGHMQLQLRLGFTMLPNGEGYAVVPPIWWTEGVATTFEYWDLHKTVDENMALLARRGRYAPLIRRMFDTEAWTDLDYVWRLNMYTWNASRTYFNYCEAWALAGYMLSDPVNGYRDFRRIMDVVKRVGENYQGITSNREIVESRAWAEAFPPEVMDKMQENWYRWVKENIVDAPPVPDEEFVLRSAGINPAVTDRFEPFQTEGERKANEEWVKKEEKRRKKEKKIEW